MDNDVSRQLSQWGPAQVCDAAAEGYASASRQLWPFAADAALRLADPGRGQRVLDVGCGPGEVVVRAAQAVGPGGSVLGLDVSARMLATARRRASTCSVRNVELVQGDLNYLPWPPEPFDVVVSAFALVFARDVAAALARMWDLVAPGGRLVVVTLGEPFFGPLAKPYLREAAREGVDVDHLVLSRRLERPEQLAAAFAAAEVPDVEIGAGSGDVLLSDGLPEWDRIVRSTELRRVDDELTAEAALRVRRAVATWARRHDVGKVSLGMVHAVATKAPAGPSGAPTGVSGCC